MKATTPSTVLTLLCLILCTSLCYCDDKDKDNQYDAGTQFWQSISGYAVIGGIILFFCGGMSLITWLVCMCHEKMTKKKRVQQMELTSGTAVPTAPDWARHLVVLPHLANQGFGIMSDGMLQVDTYHVIPHRKGDGFNDGARWAVPLSKGKHLFEIIWAWGHRGRHSAVGVGTEQASLKAKNSRSLVGKDTHSWGLDIVARRVYHQGRAVGGICPPDGSFVPDRFLMYVDMDNGKVGFGTDVTFWGYVITGLPTDGTLPLYVMASTDKWQAGIRVYYKGSEDPSGVNLQPGQSTMTSTYSMPPPPGPVYPPGSAPPAYTYIEVEPTTSDGKGKGLATPPKVAVPAGSQQTTVASPPPPYTAGEPPSY